MERARGLAWPNDAIAVTKPLSLFKAGSPGILEPLEGEQAETMATTTRIAVLAVLVVLCSDARGESVVRPLPVKRALLAGPSYASPDRPSLSLNLPVWLVESFSHPGWHPLRTSSGGGVGRFLSCGMVWLSLHGDAWSFRAGSCPPGT